MYTPEPLITRWAVKRYNQYFGTQLSYPDRKEIIKGLVLRDGKMKQPNLPNKIHFITNQVIQTDQGYNALVKERISVCGFQIRHDWIYPEDIRYQLALHGHTAFCESCLNKMKSRVRYYIHLIPPDPEDRMTYLKNKANELKKQLENDHNKIIHIGFNE